MDGNEIEINGIDSEKLLSFPLQHKEASREICVLMWE